jgi:hypothetical protein
MDRRHPGAGIADFTPGKSAERDLALARSAAGRATLLSHPRFDSVMSLLAVVWIAGERAELLLKVPGSQQQ